MTASFADLPASLPRAQVVKALESLGLPVTDLLGVRIHVYGVEVEMYARNDNGGRYLLEGGDDGRTAKHRICIPFTFGTDQPSPDADAGASPDEATG